MLIDGTDPFAVVKPNARFIKLLVRGRDFGDSLQAVTASDTADIASPYRNMHVVAHNKHRSVIWCA